MSENQVCYHHVLLEMGRHGLKSDIFGGPNGIYCASKARNKGRDEYGPNAVIYEGKVLFPSDPEECKDCPHYAAS